ncbi:hypothetical protein EDM56_26020 [Brevibacillus fluminis]|uniref:Uncharacterized protein n=1 Tax=Brevibacillus fluminis TaxID=511487 RepID=A0A3M8CZA8_9BACL|nr:O-antigen ligase family protein [Brevibacillus fluminis]RNB81182.1 hypothetical protein EDM56_26020 [Brevibacillus fluminis]
MEQFLQLVKDYWPIALVGLLVIVAFQWIVRSLFRLVAILAVVGVILVVFFQFSSDQVINMGRTAVKNTEKVVQQTITPLLNNELKDADITFQPDGTYEMKTASIRITGKKGESKATVYYKEEKWDVDIGQLGNLFQEQLKKAEDAAELKAQ